MEKPIFPKIRVKLTGKSANFFSVLNATDVAMEKADIPLNIRKKYIREAARDWDYDKMITVTRKWVKIS